MTKLAMIVGPIIDARLFFYFSDNAEFKEQTMSGMEESTKYIDLFYGGLHAVRVISALYMHILDDSHARKQYSNIWWITSPMFMLFALYEITFNTSLFQPCS